MSIVDIKATKYTCNGCGGFELVEKGDPEPPLGVQLKGQWHFGGGGGPVNIYLCEPDCVPLSKAIVNMIEEDRKPLHATSTPG